MMDRPRFKVIENDLLRMSMVGFYDVIVHGCNCFHVMGSGLALALRNKWPSVYEADLQSRKGDRSKLGSYTMTRVVVPTLFGSHQTLRIVNAYTQYGYGHPDKGVSHFDLDALRQVLTTINGKAKTNSRFGLPVIGGGRGGGNEQEILDVIRETLTNHYVTVVKYSGAHEYQRNATCPTSCC